MVSKKISRLVNRKGQLTDSIIGKEKILIGIVTVQVITKDHIAET